MAIDPLFLRVLMITFECICIGLSLTLVYLFFRIYNTRRSIFLLGLPFGFFFLMVSSIFLTVHLIDLTSSSTANISIFSSSIMWLRVVTQTVGFILIALSYLSAGRYQNTTKRSYMIILSGTGALIFTFFMLLMLVNPTGLESVYSDNDIFAVINVVLLSYIIFFLIRKMQVQKIKISDFILAPVAFVIFWLGQFSFLLFSFAQGGDAALVGSQVARLVSLALFIKIYYDASKETSTDANDQT